MTIKKPHLACDYDEEKLKFPLVALPKLDGVRGLNVESRFVGRSLKRFDNPFLATRFDGVDFQGLDGEVAFGPKNSLTLCRDTTGFVNRQTPKPGKPVIGEVDWHVFDLLDTHTIKLGYLERLAALDERVRHLHLPYVQAVPYELVNDLDRLEFLEGLWLDDNMEGVIIRDPNGLHKDGRATVTKGAYMRIKRFTDAEFIVEELVEAMENKNEAKTNELGRTERSSHKENKVAKGMIGTIKGTLLNDVVYRGQTLFEKGMQIEAGAGTMCHTDRIYFWKHPDELLKKIGKVKLFPHGTKEKMRFPTWAGLRAAADMSE